MSSTQIHGNFHTPITLHRELRVTASAETDTLTPPDGKRIRVLGYFASQQTGQALTSTVRATLTFGTDHTTDADKIIASYRLRKADAAACAIISNLNLLGEVDEVVTLTNITYSAGDAITRTVLYYELV